MEEIKREFQCSDCAHQWKVSFGSGRQMACPSCRSDKFKRINPGIGGPGREKGNLKNGRKKCS